MKKMRLLCAVGFLSLALNSSAQTEGTFTPDEKYKVSASVSLGGNLLAPEETPNVTCNLGKYGLEGWELESVGDGNYFFSSQNSPDADGGKPQSGTFYRMNTFADGIVKLSMYMGEVAANGNLYVLNGNDARFVDGTKANTRTGTRFREGTNKKGDKCIKITNAAKKYVDIFIPVKAGDSYYVYVSAFDKFGLSGYSFDVVPGSEVDPADSILNDLFNGLF